MDSRVIKLKGVENLRDLGGLKTKNGQLIKSGHLLRSDNLSKLSLEGISVLENEYNLKKVVDLRMSMEISERPDKEIPGSQHICIPIFEHAVLGITRENASLDNIAEVINNLTKMEDLYALMVTDDNCLRQFSAALHEILEVKDGTVLWHCTAGKDRCGLLSVFVLSILGVDEESIIKDYLMTNDTAVRKAKKVKYMLLLKTHDLEIASKVMTMFLADETYIKIALDRMKEESGSVIGFIKEKLNITQEEIDDFKIRMLI